MIETRLEYNKRLSEVEIYFHFIGVLENGRCSLKCVDIMSQETNMPIDADLSKILKANGFLLLYNLIEATIRKSVDAIIRSIHTDGVSFDSISDELKKIWIKQETKNIRGLLDTGVIADKVYSISKTILENQILSFEKECINISGNIDAQEIRKIFKQIGSAELSNGRCLKTIKDKRNHLAHGEFTFTDIGKDYTVRELVAFKEGTKEYLSKVLDEIQVYIDGKKYLHP